MIEGILILFIFVLSGIIIRMKIKDKRNIKEISSLNNRIKMLCIEIHKYDNVLNQIIDACDDKNIKGVRIAQEKIKELATRPIIPSSN